MSEEHLKKFVFLQILAGMCILCFISVFYSFTLISSRPTTSNKTNSELASAETKNSIKTQPEESAVIISEIYQAAQTQPATSFSVTLQDLPAQPMQATSVSLSLSAGNISKRAEEKAAQNRQTKDAGLEYYRDLYTRTAVISFYTQLTGNATVTDAILTYAAKNDIPLSLAFALAWGESRYKTAAVNRNTNNSIDRGLFQLNNKSFPKIAEKDFFDPYVSARYGLAHLSFCIQTAGNEVSGLAMYNAGTGKVKKDGTPRQTLNYISIILNYRNAVDELFESEVVNGNQTAVFIAKAE